MIDWCALSCIGDQSRQTWFLVHTKYYFHLMLLLLLFFLQGKRSCISSAIVFTLDITWCTTSCKLSVERVFPYLIVHIHCINTNCTFSTTIKSHIVTSQNSLNMFLIIAFLSPGFVYDFCRIFSNWLNCANFYCFQDRNAI